MSEDKHHKISKIKDRYLSFFLEGEQYGIEIGSVKEIIAIMKTTHIPKTAKYIKGVMNLRGNIIPVVDMRIKFGMAEKAPEMQTAIIIVTIENSNIGFVVDRVEEVVSISEAQFSEPPKFGTKVDTTFIKYMAKVKDEVIMILELDKIFSQDELVGIESLAKDKD